MSFKATQPMGKSKPKLQIMKKIMKMKMLDIVTCERRVSNTQTRKKINCLLQNV